MRANRFTITLALLAAASAFSVSTAQAQPPRYYSNYGRQQVTQYGPRYGPQYGSSYTPYYSTGYRPGFYPGYSSGPGAIQYGNYPGDVRISTGYYYDPTTTYQERDIRPASYYYTPTFYGTGQYYVPRTIYRRR